MTLNSTDPLLKLVKVSFAMILIFNKPIIYKFDALLVESYLRIVNSRGMAHIPNSSRTHPELIPNFLIKREQGKLTCFINSQNNKN